MGGYGDSPLEREGSRAKEGGGREGGKDEQTDRQWDGRMDGQWDGGRESDRLGGNKVKQRARKVGNRLGP